MASQRFELGRPTNEAAEIARMIERGLRDSKALDTEALCILAGAKVCLGTVRFDRGQYCDSVTG